MSVDIKTNTELFDVAKLFYIDDCPNVFLTVLDERNFCVDIDGVLTSYTYSDNFYNVIPLAHRVQRLSKIAVYDALCAYTGRSMPWGALTGVRPTKLFYECLRAGYGAQDAVLLMQKVYRVSYSRAEILDKIVSAQRDKVFYSDDYFNLYVHVPYCTTRCSYCSFVSMPIDKCKEQSKMYVKLLCDEIKQSIDFLASRGKKLLSVYIGGGTPTALGDNQLVDLLSSINVSGVEYTCEAGRPDTVTKEKCIIMKEHGVNRICVNPQTLNEYTLKKIGRSHSVKQFFDAYDCANSMGFDINCDLIAGLEDESLDDFVHSFNGIKALVPHNITVHSLSKKNGSAIRYTSGENEGTSSMLDYVLSHMDKYNPYYLYRQKRQSGNLENIGLSLPNKECINNITTMEETVSVVACGAGAISKLVDNNKIIRHANVRDVGLYITEYGDRLKAKHECFSNVFDKSV
ncbi:MAG: coproporphyrinogen dehydrogenase HemZ [Clostridiales bacterium]|nr:coproporphyrinogen dehydrogenase HemZ [Clostridiales bacterium]